LKSLLHLLIFAVIFVGCSKEPNSRKLQVFHADLTGDDLDGGAVLVLKNMVTNVETTYEFTSTPYDLTIPEGTWGFLFVGFEGPNKREGNIHCGATQATLTPGEADVNITISSACNTIAFQDIINSKSPRFDYATFDHSNFAP
jgi:hypothetical protein